MSVNIIKLSKWGYVQMYWSNFKSWIKNPNQYYRNKRKAHEWLKDLYERSSINK